MGWASSGFEIGNKLDARTYPLARVKRPGAPPSTQPPGADPNEQRGAPVRARAFAFELREFGGRALLATPGFVGPGLIKELSITRIVTLNTNPLNHINIFWNTTPYVSVGNLAVTTVPAGTPIFESGSVDDQPGAFAEEGGITTDGLESGPHRHRINLYVPAQQFYCAIVLRNPAAAPAVVTGSLLVYEGVLLSDFPAILA
jgi:hypothetical protein